MHVIWDIIHAPQLRIRTDYYSLDECIEVTGENGIIKITRATGRMLDEPVLTVYRDGEVRAFHNIETDWGASFEACTRALVASLRTGGEVPLSGEDGRQVMELAIAVAEAAATGRAVEIPQTPQPGPRA